MLLVREIILQLENLSSPFLRNISQLTLLHERTENQISCVSKKKKPQQRNMKLKFGIMGHWALLELRPYWLLLQINVLFYQFP